MSLADLQSALGGMVVAHASVHGSLTDPSFGSLNLSAEERAWLAELAGSPGFKVTCKIQRWWRQTKIVMAVKLTQSALGADRGAELVKRYLDEIPCTSLFFIPEAVGFLEFVADEAGDQPHVSEVARFERAVLLSRQAALEASDSIRQDLEGEPTQFLKPHAAADVVPFGAPPELLLGSLLGDQPLPEVRKSKSPVLIAPRLPRLWRPATADEYRIFECSRAGATKEQLVALMPGAAAILNELLSAGAFCEETRLGTIAGRLSNTAPSGNTQLSS